MTYHMMEISSNPGCVRYWLEGLRAKYEGKGERYGKEELDKLLGGYSARFDHVFARFGFDVCYSARELTRMAIAGDNGHPVSHVQRRASLCISNRQSHID